MNLEKIDGSRWEETKAETRSARILANKLSQDHRGISQIGIVLRMAAATMAFDGTSSCGSTT